MLPFQTVFYFDIQQKNFREALDRFANFFIKPLLKRDSMEREIMAVDSGQCYQSINAPFSTQLFSEHIKVPNIQ